MRRLTTEEFIKKAELVHKGKYDYSNVVYEKNNVKVDIKCNKCGNIFKQTPNNHMNGQGCPKCSNSPNVRLTNEEFIERLIKIHGNKYDTSLVEYVNIDAKVKLICHEKDKFGDEHGIFEASPHSLCGTAKSGCPKCSKKYRKSTEYFIRELRDLYGDKYDYSKVEYNGAFKDVTLICPKHGEFRSIPNWILSGKGCQACAESKIENEIRQFLNCNDIDFIAQYRNRRILGLQSLDFFLPKYNIGIECQGLHHFRAIDFFGGENGYKKVVEMDSIKKKHCEENGIKLLYYSNLGIEYPYKVYEDKEELLKEIVGN